MYDAAPLPSYMQCWKKFPFPWLNKRGDASNELNTEWRKKMLPCWLRASTPCVDGRGDGGRSLNVLVSVKKSYLS